MDDLAHCRAMAAFCRQRAAFENENDAFWIAEAENWDTLISEYVGPPHQAQTGRAAQDRDDRRWSGL